MDLTDEQWAELVALIGETPRQGLERRHVAATVLCLARTPASTLSG